MQSVAMGWLVYRLTGSAQMLGAITFLNQVPSFLFGAWSGTLADRLPRKRVFFCTQAAALLQASLLAALTFTGAVRAWHLFPLALLLGLATALEMPSRHSLIADLAGEDTPNAVALNSTLVNGARVLGPAVAGILISAVGEAWCFLFNAVSFGAVLIAIARMKVEERARSPEGGGLLEGLRYAQRVPLIRALLMLLFAGSFLAAPFQALMPVVVANLLGGGPRLYGQLLACVGLGALVAAVALLRRTGTQGLARTVGLGAALLGIGVAGAGLSHSAWLTAGFLVVAGYGFINQNAGTLTLLQALAPDALRGRLMGLFSMLFIGSAPFGALVSGWAAGRFGVTPTLLAGGIATVAAAVAFQRAGEAAAAAEARARA